MKWDIKGFISTKGKVFEKALLWKFVEHDEN